MNCNAMHHQTRIYTLASIDETNNPEFNALLPKYSFSPQGEYKNKQTIELGIFNPKDDIGSAAKDLLNLSFVLKVSVSKSDPRLIKTKLTKEAFDNFKYWGQE